METCAERCLGPADPDELRDQRRGFDAIAKLAEDARTIVICAHTSPDGDALGSVLGLAEVMRARWPRANVTTLLADDADVPRIYRFLPGADHLVRPCDYEEVPDLFVAVDLPIASRLNEARAVCERAKHVAVMDHHPSEMPFGDASVVRSGAAAAGIIVAEFAMHIGVDITPTMAQNLFCAIMTDTGRFQYQNADGESFEVASMLVDAGASPSTVSLNVYQSFRLQSLHLKALVLGRITTFERGRIAYSYATQNDLERTGADLDELDGLIDAVRSVEGSQIALFLKAVPGGKVRGNLRSKCGYDVSGVAKTMGGGGHRAAAGFTYKGDIDEALSAVLPSLRRLLKESDASGDACSGAAGGDAS